MANREANPVDSTASRGTKIHSINLLDESVVGSPYYFIQPNDVLYAEPLSAPGALASRGLNGEYDCEYVEHLRRTDFVHHFIESLIHV